jgi:hypothetical protein
MTHPKAIRSYTAGAALGPDRHPALGPERGFRPTAVVGDLLSAARVALQRYVVPHRGQVRQQLEPYV